MPRMTLDALAPDQRAVVQLVLQRGRSYEQIADVLKISEDAVRARAHLGLAALAPGVELPADKLAPAADFLLGQRDAPSLLHDDPAAREWAETVRASLEDVGDVPELPAAEGEPLAAAVRPAPRPRPLREARPRTRPVAATDPEGAVAASSSRLGGALLIGGGVLAIVVVVLILFVFGGDDDSGGGKDKATAATPTPTASTTPQAVGRIDLKGVNGGKGRGVMTLYASQGQLAFTLEGTGVPQNKSNEAYAVWFTSPGGAAQRLGFAQPVGKNGQLGTTGPRTEDLDKFPRWLARYKQVVVSRERDGKARKPGPVVLQGALPSA
jgi:hypothetical protein